MKISSAIFLILDAVARSSVLLAVHQLSPGAAMLASPMPFFESQPDGQVVELRIHGDDHDNWMADMDGYTVLRHPATDAFVYAELDDNGELQPSDEEVAQAPHNADGDILVRNMMDNDVTKISKKQKNLRPTKRDCTTMLCGEEDYDYDDDLRSNHNLRGGGQIDPSRKLGSSTGTMRNLVLLLRWSDNNPRVLPTRAQVDVLMNNKGPHPLCPTGSVRDVFLENSYGALKLESVVTPWILMDNTELYYSNSTRGLTPLMWDAIRYGLRFVEDRKLVDFSSFDVDGDGEIDSLTVLHSGYGAEFGGTDSAGRFYMDRIWSHKWGLNNGAFVSRDGVKVHQYHISTALWSTEGSQIGRIGTIAHETGHFLGLPDLYDTDGGGHGIGTYGLMGNIWGFDGQQQNPPHMSPWAKEKMGWVDFHRPTPGVNTIEATQVQNATHPQVYIVTDGFPDNEFLLIENRQPMGFDSILPQGGLAIWHIDLTKGRSSSRFKRSHNREGHPWQENWPQNGNHYGTALLQADGLFDLERFQNQGDEFDLFHAGGVNEITPCLDPNNCQQPNTDSYQGGVVGHTDVYITDISISGPIMTFNYNLGPPTDEPTESPTPAPSFRRATPAPTLKATVPPNATVAATTCLAVNKVCQTGDQCCSGSCREKRKQCR